jgi:hypothetical protein
MPAAAGAVSISWLAKLTRTATNFPHVRFGHASDPSGLVRPDVCRPEIVARRASSSQLKFGRTSAPLWPQTWQVNSGSRSDSRTSSGHLSPLIAVQRPRSRNPLLRKRRPMQSNQKAWRQRTANRQLNRLKTVPLPKRVEDAPRERAKGPDDRYCSEHYRSYDPASRTYTGYDGQRRSCR